MCREKSLWTGAETGSPSSDRDSKQIPAQKRKLFTTINWMKIDLKEGLCVVITPENLLLSVLFLPTVLTFIQHVQFFPPNKRMLEISCTSWLCLSRWLKEFHSLFLTSSSSVTTNSTLFRISSSLFRKLADIFGNFRKPSEFLRLSSEIPALPG